MPRTYTRSPGALILARHGVNLRQVAVGLGVAVSTVSAYLRGDIAPRTELFTVVRALAGAEAAEDLAQALEQGNR